MRFPLRRWYPHTTYAFFFSPLASAKRLTKLLITLCVNIIISVQTAPSAFAVSAKEMIGHRCCATITSLLDSSTRWRSWFFFFHAIRLGHHVLIKFQYTVAIVVSFPCNPPRHCLVYNLPWCTTMVSSRKRLSCFISHDRLHNSISYTAQCLSAGRNLNA